MEKMFMRVKVGETCKYFSYGEWHVVTKITSKSVKSPICGNGGTMTVNAITPSGFETYIWDGTKVEIID